MKFYVYEDNAKTARIVSVQIPRFFAKIISSFCKAGLRQAGTAGCAGFKGAAEQTTPLEFVQGTGDMKVIATWNKLLALLSVEQSLKTI